MLTWQPLSSQLYRRPTFGRFAKLAGRLLLWWWRKDEIEFYIHLGLALALVVFLVELFMLLCVEMPAA
jgi:hypothetical protein